MSAEAANPLSCDRRKGQDRRKQTSRSVRDVRQKLASNSGARPEFHYDLLYMFAKNELGAALAIPVLAIIVAAASFYWTNTSAVILWLAAVFVSKGILLMMCRTFLMETRGEADLPKWRQRLTLAAFLSGCSWAGITLVSVPGAEPTADIIIFATLIVVLCIRTMFASTVMSIIYASTLPMTAALVARFVMADAELYWVMAAMAIGVHAYFMVLTRGLNHTVLSMLELRAEKDALIAEIEESKAISDEARLRAESANFAKSRFLATMSHELRTPLNAILGFSEILKSELFGPHSNPTYKDYARDIHESGEHLLRLINDILDLSRIEADRYDLQEEAVPLSGVVHDCLRLLRLRAENKGLHIKELIDEDLPKLWAEEKAIRQVCLNLLSNAIKFTPKGGTITIEVGARDDGQQFLAIHDTGPGIDEEEIPKILSPFGQGSLAQEAAEGGTGLGLPIVIRLMELHGGDFSLKSELRRGTSVTATFPLKRSMKALPPMPLSGEVLSAPAAAKPAAQPRRSAPAQKQPARETSAQAAPEKTDAPAAHPPAPVVTSQESQRAAKIVRKMPIKADPGDQNGEARREAHLAKPAKTHLHNRNEQRRRLEQLAYGQKSTRAAKLHTTAPAPSAEEPSAEEEHQKLRELAQSLRAERLQTEESGAADPSSDIPPPPLSQTK